MNRSIAAVVLAVSMAAVLVPAVHRAEGVPEETAEHPRIAKAIQEMQEAIWDLEAAPHNFGGHKAAAIRDTRKAMEQLRLALRYRAVQDTKRGK